MNRYIAGNNISKVLKASKKQLSHNKLPIINYIVEKTSRPQDIFMEYVSLIEKIDYSDRSLLRNQIYYEKTFDYNIKPSSVQDLELKTFISGS